MKVRRDGGTNSSWEGHRRHGDDALEQASKAPAGTHDRSVTAVWGVGEEVVSLAGGSNITVTYALSTHKHPPLPRTSYYIQNIMASGDSLMGLASEFLSLVENSEPPEGSDLATLKANHGVAYPTSVMEEMQGLISDLHTKKIPKYQLGALVDGLKWNVSDGIIKAVTGVHVRLTRMGPTMVADVTCVDPEGGVFTLKEMPLTLARGHHYGSNG